jgi:hypothetical protein
MTTLVFHTDPGHGWLQVPRKMLTELGISGEISPYSYEWGDYVFLEEDMDAGTFGQAYVKKHGKSPEFVARYQENNPIRHYSSYQPNK